MSLVSQILCHATITHVSTNLVVNTTNVMQKMYSVEVIYTENPFYFQLLSTQTWFSNATEYATVI